MSVVFSWGHIEKTAPSMTCIWLLFEPHQYNQVFLWQLFDGLMKYRQYGRIVCGNSCWVEIGVIGLFTFLFLFRLNILLSNTFYAFRESALKNRLWLKSAWIDQKRVQRSFIILRIYYEVAKVCNRSSYDANLLTLRALIC